MAKRDRRLLITTLCAGVMFAAPTAGAQSASGPSIPPIRPLGPIVARTKDMLGNVGGVRPLSDGRVLVDDPISRRVILLDASLQRFIDVADTTSETAKAYGSRGGGLLPFTNDSSVFVDLASSSLLVIDPNGKISHVMAGPPGPGGGLVYLAASGFGAAFDGRGRLVSSWNYQKTPRPDSSAGLRGVPIIDSLIIRRVDLVSKRADTIARLTTPIEFTRPRPPPPPNTIVFRDVPMRLANPMPSADDWALMPDGTVAVVRASDFHVDWYPPEGPSTSTPKIHHEWQHLTDSAKTAIIDSLYAADSLTCVSGRGGDFAGGKCTVGAATRAGRGGRGGMMSFAKYYVDPPDLPDYRPPFDPGSPDDADRLIADGAVKADADGNLWIRVNPPMRPAGGLIYDIVNRRGMLVDRVQIPGGTKIAAFAPGFVYLTARVGTGYQVARARFR